jgi:hypothetical protein
VGRARKRSFRPRRTPPPSIEDERVTFVKGLFQDTVDQALLGIDVSKYEAVVVHFDADLFSSTLFAMTKILEKTSGFFAIFDEFSGDETRAYHALECAFRLKATRYGHVDVDDRPTHVSCRIERG